MCLNETYGKVWDGTRLFDILYPKLSWGEGAWAEFKRMLYCHCFSTVI